MASIRKIETKRGTAYKITVLRGRDALGRQIRNYKTYYPPDGLTVREVKREVQRVAVEFEHKIELGYDEERNPSFSEYAAYCLELRKQAGDKPATLDRMERELSRTCEFIGNMKLKDIRPQHLNELYSRFSQHGAGKTEEYAVLVVDLMQYRQDGETLRDFVQRLGTNDATLRHMKKGGRVSRKTAQTVETTLGEKGLFSYTWKEKPLSPKSIQCYHGVIFSVFKQAYKEMLIEYNPAERVTLPKMRKVRETSSFTPEEVKTILDALRDEPTRMKAMILLFLTTGCRRGELCALKWEKINLPEREILIDSNCTYVQNYGLQFGTTKTGKNRRVAIPADTAEALRKLKAEQAETRLKMGDLWPDNGLVFRNLNGMPLYPCFVNREINGFTERHGLPHINPHKFRHTAASLLISEGVDVLTVAGMLGHSRVSTTLDIYSHEIASARHRTADKMEEIFFSDCAK